MRQERYAARLSLKEILKNKRRGMAIGKTINKWGNASRKNSLGKRDPLSTRI